MAEAEKKLATLRQKLAQMQKVPGQTAGANKSFIQKYGKAIGVAAGVAVAGFASKEAGEYAGEYMGNRDAAKMRQTVDAPKPPVGVVQVEFTNASPRTNEVASVTPPAPAPETAPEVVKTPELVVPLPASAPAQKAPEIKPIESSSITAPSMGWKVSSATEAAKTAPESPAPSAPSVAELKKRVEEALVAKAPEAKTAGWRRDANFKWFRELPGGGKEVAYESGRSMVYDAKGILISTGFLKPEVIKELFSGTPEPEKSAESAPMPQKREIRTGGSTITTGQTLHVGGLSTGGHPVDRSAQTGVPEGRNEIFQTPRPFYADPGVMYGPQFHLPPEMMQHVDRAYRENLAKAFPNGGEKSSDWMVIQGTQARKFMKMSEDKVAKEYGEQYRLLHKYLLQLEKASGISPESNFLRTNKQSIDDYIKRVLETIVLREMGKGYTR